MIVADILMWFLLIVGTYIVFVSYWLATQGLFPDFVDRCRLRISTHPYKQGLMGLAITVPGVVAAIAMMNAPNPALKFVGVALLLLLILMGLLGSSGLASQVGLGLTTDRDQQWRKLFRGGAVLGLTFILPGVGWFLILPLTLMMGVSSAILSFRGSGDASIMDAA